MTERALKSRRRQEVLDNFVKGKINNSRKTLPRSLMQKELESCQRRLRLANQPLVIDEIDSNSSRDRVLDEVTIAEEEKD